MFGTLVRMCIGGLAILLFLVGKGARTNSARLDSASEYWFGTGIQLLGLLLLLLVFAVWRVSRLRGPAKRSPWMELRRLGWLFLIVGGLGLLSLVSLFLTATNVDSAGGMIAAAIVTSPDIMVKIVIALMAIGAGATALAGTTTVWSLLLAVAVPLGLIWPHGLALAAWTAWSSLGRDTGRDQVLGHT